MDGEWLTSEVDIRQWTLDTWTGGSGQEKVDGGQLTYGGYWTWTVIGGSVDSTRWKPTVITDQVIGDRGQWKRTLSRDY